VFQPRSEPRKIQIQPEKVTPWDELIYTDVFRNTDNSKAISVLNYAPSLNLDVPGVEVQSKAFIISVVDGGKWLASRSCGFTPEEKGIGRRVGFTVCQKAVERGGELAWPCLLPNPGFSIIQSLYRLNYRIPNSFVMIARNTYVINISADTSLPLRSSILPKTRFLPETEPGTIIVKFLSICATQTCYCHTWGCTKFEYLNTWEM
jgi:hypothetical protein